MKTNTATFSGHLGADPEEVQGNSRTFTRGRLAVSQGREKPTIWLDLVAFDKWSAEDLGKASKGDRVTVTGKLTLREWTGKDGQIRESLGITISNIETFTPPPAAKAEPAVQQGFDEADDLPF